MPRIRSAALLLLCLHSGSAFLSQPSSSSSTTSIQNVRSPVTLSSVLTSNTPPSSSNVRFDDELIDNRHSASDWLYNVLSFPQSRVLREIRNPLLSVFGWALAVSGLQRLGTTTLSGNAFLHSLATHMSIPTAAHSFLVSSLGLLLVFRTNSAYQRFYEGRKIWENILSVSRNLSRMTRLYAKEIGMDRKVRVMNLVAAFPYLLRHHIRHGCLCDSNDGRHIPEQHRILLEDPLKALETRFEGDNASRNHNNGGGGGTANSNTQCYADQRNLPWCLFDSTSVARLARTQNRPLWVCDKIGREIMDIAYGNNFSSRERLAMLSSVDKLTNAIGECERIHQTAVPLNYARHSLRSLTLFLFTLPFALVKDMGLFTAPVTAGIAWLYFGVYQIGYSIEDPFQGTLRLSNLCDAIRRDVVGSVAEDMEESLDLDPDDFWSNNEATLQAQTHLWQSSGVMPPTSAATSTGLFGQPPASAVSQNATKK